MTKETIIKLFDEWNNAIQSGNPDQVVALYDEAAVLLPTVSNQVRHNHEEIKDYFVHFLKKSPVGRIDESNVRLFESSAVNSGVYTFKFSDNQEITARYTFIYEQINGEWKIVGHHSSAMPE